MVGKLGHLHPVVVLVILTIAEKIGGMWGLLLGVPIAVFIIRVVLLGTGIPGITDRAVLDESVDHSPQSNIS